MLLGKYDVDEDAPLLVGEVGINHNGDIKIAKQLIDVCSMYGWHFVKFQTRTVDVVYTKEQLDTPRESPWGTTNREQKNGLELSYDEYIEIDDYCKQKEIKWTSSPWDLKAAKFLSRFNLPFIKIASACTTDRELLEYVTQLNIPIVISTGGLSRLRLSVVVAFLKARMAKDMPLIILYCVPQYPCPVEAINLNAIDFLRAFEDHRTRIGYSGHELGILVASLAASKNVCMIEKHITMDRAMYGSDQSASLEPEGMRRVVRDIKVVKQVFGDVNLSDLAVTDKDAEIMYKLRRVDTV